MDPPGCKTAATPASPAISTQSGKGKKASEAITLPLISKPKDCAFSIACFNASTRDVCPTPEATKVLFLAKTIRSEEHTSELQSRENLVCRLLLEKKNNNAQ